MARLSPSPATPRYSALGNRVSSPTIARLMAQALANPELLSLAAGFTDNASLPAETVAAAAAELAERGERDVLQYGSNSGRPGLRRRLVERLAAQETAEPRVLDPDRVFITNGSQQALYLAVQVLCEPGDLVLVDQPSYFVFLEMLAGLGVRACSIPVDAAGCIDAEALRQLLGQMRADGRLERLRAVYFVSYYSNPSGRTLAVAEKEALATVLAEADARVPVIEDAAYREMYYEQPSPVPSVHALEAWRAFPRLYLSTLTKPFATGLKVGYGICSDDDWRSRMLHVKGHQDFGTAHFNQAVYEVVLGDGRFDAQLQVIRPLYQRKMQALDTALREEGLPQLGWSWSRPEGGLYLWLTAPETIDTGINGAFCRECIEAGVLYVPGELCLAEGQPTNRLRLSFGVLSEASLRAAAGRLAGVARQYHRRTS